MNHILREGVSHLEWLALEMHGRQEAKNTKKGDWKGREKIKGKRPWNAHSEIWSSFWWDLGHHVVSKTCAIFTSSNTNMELFRSSLPVVSHCFKHEGQTPSKAEKAFWFFFFFLPGLFFFPSLIFCHSVLGLSPSQCTYIYSKHSFYLKHFDFLYILYPLSLL